MKRPKKGQRHNAGGGLDFYIDEAHIKELFPAGLSLTKFTFQLSDHLPLWMQISTDIDGEKLEELIQDQAALEISRRVSVAAGLPRYRVHTFSVGWRRKAAASVFSNRLFAAG